MSVWRRSRGRSGPQAVSAFPPLPWMSRMRIDRSYREQSRRKTRRLSRFSLSQGLLCSAAHGAQPSFFVRAGRGRRVARGCDRRKRGRRRSHRLGRRLGRPWHPRRSLRRHPRRRVHGLQALPERLLTRVGILGAPRPMPRSWVPALGGGLVIALALPVFLVAGWRLSGWAIAAILWDGAQCFGLLLARFRPSPDNLAGSGVLAFGMMIRMLAVLVVLLVVASTDGDAGL